MDDGRGPGVQEVKAFQDLPAPTSQHFGLHDFETLQVALGKRKIDINSQHIFHSREVKKTKFFATQVVHVTAFNKTHVFSVPDVMSSVTKTIHFFPLRGDSQKS